MEILQFVQISQGFQNNFCFLSSMSGLWLQIWFVWFESKKNLFFRKSKDMKDCDGVSKNPMEFGFYGILSDWIRYY